MVCKKCGFNIENDWKYCPNCSKKIYKKQNIIFISTVILIVIIFIIMPIIENNRPVDAKYIEKQLEKKYKENFNNVSLIESVENPDTNLNCDGSSFGTIKGEGSTEYYKVYSKKNDIEFIATYDTSNKSKKINDSYDDSLKRRSTLIAAYKIINNRLNSKINKISLSSSSSDTEIDISTESQLEDILSKYEENNKDLENFEIYISEDLYNFSKSNYEIITKLNDEIVTLKKNKDYYFFTTIVLNERAIIELYRLDNKAYVYDKLGNQKAWGEPLDEFVRRESY